VKAVLLDYLEAAHAAGFREVRIIHGQGIGVQRQIVQHALDVHPLVVEFWDVWHLGATGVKLADR
jgi:dsDNA-specific endonuclease/ATPase MutS2